MGKSGKSKRGSGARSDMPVQKYLIPTKSSVPPLPDSLVNLSYLLKHYPLLKAVLPILLEDRTSGFGKKKRLCRNIVWATDSYAHLGAEFAPDAPITIEALESLEEHGEEIRPRVLKRDDERRKRSKERAEVFTPSRICASMNEFCDRDWFGRETPIFSKETPDGWECVDSYLDVLKEFDWEEYVKSRRLEITCGEAPFIVSRYDASTGERIPIEKRVGILDRKLRIIGAPKGESKNNEPRVIDQDNWLEGALWAFQSVYGYEYQGDSLLIARINVFMTLIDYFADLFDSFDVYEPLMLKQAKQFANVIAWNFWQMNGLTLEAPGNPNARVKDIKESQAYFEAKKSERLLKNVYNDRSLLGYDNSNIAKTRDWQREHSYNFRTRNHEGRIMKFDYVIGNPPYQEEIKGSKQKKSVYYLFMMESYKVSRKVLLITPGRFLFPNDQSRSKLNKKLLNDPHLKVVYYEWDHSKIFSDVDIKGGIAISFRNEGKKIGPIGLFFRDDNLETIYQKVLLDNALFNTLDDYVYGYNKWDLDILYSDHPELLKILPGNVRDRKELGAAVFTQVPIFRNAGGGTIILKLSV